MTTRGEKDRLLHGGCACARWTTRSGGWAPKAVKDVLETSWPASVVMLRFYAVVGAAAVTSLLVGASVTHSFLKPNLVCARIFTA